MEEALYRVQEWTPTLVARLEKATLELEEDYLDRLRFPARRHQVVLALGGIPVGIHTDSDGIAGHLSERYGCFAVSAHPVIRLALGETSVAAFPFRTLVGTMMTYARGTHTVGKFRGMAGYVDSAARSGSGLIGGDNYLQDLSNYLRLVINAMTPPLGAVLFHTAAVARDGRAYLFFGPSTAGKSTLTRLAAERYPIMTDDMLVLRLEEGRLRAATCGFWGGETKCYPTEHVDAPVAALFRLHKAPVNAARRLDAMAAAAEVVCGVPNLRRPISDQRFLLELAHTVGERTPCYELDFHKRDDSFWKVIDELV